MLINEFEFMRKARQDGVAWRASNNLVYKGARLSFYVSLFPDSVNGVLWIGDEKDYGDSFRRHTEIHDYTWGYGRVFSKIDDVFESVIFDSVEKMNAEFASKVDLLVGKYMETRPHPLPVTSLKLGR